MNNCMYREGYCYIWRYFIIGVYDQHVESATVSHMQEISDVLHDVGNYIITSVDKAKEDGKVTGKVRENIDQETSTDGSSTRIDGKFNITYNT